MGKIDRPPVTVTCGEDIRSVCIQCKKAPREDPSMFGGRSGSTMTILYLPDNCMVVPTIGAV
jgi:hypothetical protein